ncbi:hypothetical protein N9571_01740 [Yoonia sp.]|nr:hypothetical protein [Yoonia sp.]
MTRTALIFCAVLTVASCGTTRGVLDGTGTMLEGVAMDLRSAGNMFGR